VSDKFGFIRCSSVDEILAIRAFEIEMPEDAEFVGVPARRLDGEHVERLAERAGMNLGIDYQDRFLPG